MQLLRLPRGAEERPRHRVVAARLRAVGFLVELTFPERLKKMVQKLQEKKKKPKNRR